MKTLSDFLEKAAQSRNGITLVEPSKDDFFISYKELLDDAKDLLGGLQSKGITRGDSVVLYTTENKSFLVAFWACILGQIIPVPISAGTGLNHLSKLVRIARELTPCSLIVDDRLKKLIYETVENATDKVDVLRVLTFHELCSSRNKAEIAKISPKEIAFIQFSSGSTGNPKGVVLTHHNLYYNVSDISNRAQISNKDTLLSWMPLTHDMGMICCHLTGLMTGANQILMPPYSFIRNPLIWMDKAHQYKATLLFSPNFGYEYFLQQLSNKRVFTNRWNLSNVRLIFNGAEMISDRICEKFISELQRFQLSKRAMYPGYGLAEASVAVSLPEIDQGYKTLAVNFRRLAVGERIVYSEENDKSFKLVTLGFPMYHTQIRIVNDNDENLPEEFLGNIQVRGENVMQTYFSKEKNSNVFTHDGWLRTGDLGFITKGELVLTGRKKNLIIINGQNYFPDDLEYVIAQSLNIDKDKVAACCRFNEKKTIEELFIFVRCKNRAEEKERLLDEKIRSTLNDNFGIIATDVVFIKRFPKTTSGKLQYQKLLDDYILSRDKKNSLEGHIVQNHDRTFLKRKFKTLYKEVSGKALPEVQRPGQYFSNSLLAIYFLNKLREEGISLQASDLFRCKDLDEIISCMIHLDQNGEKTEHIIDSKADLNLSQQRFLFLHDLSKDKSALNIVLRFDVVGDITKKQLLHATEKLLETYPVLKACVKGGQLHLTNLSPAQLLKISNDGATDFNEPFDLKSGPLWRIGFDLKENQLWLIVHHIISDGWSMNLMVKSLTKAINGVSILNEETVFGRHSFKDRMFAANPIENQQKYWKTFIANNDFANRLGPVCRDIDDYTVSNLEMKLDAKFIDRLVESAKNSGTTPFIVLLSGVLLSLGKLLSVENVIVGTNIAAREVLELENELGLFMRTLLVKGEVVETLSCSEFVRKIALSYYRSADNRDFHFDNLLKMKQNGQEDFPDELFEILVLYQKFDFLKGKQMDVKGVQLVENSPLPNYALPPVTIEFVHREKLVLVKTSYRSSVYKTEQIETFNDALIRSLTFIIENPESRLQDLDLNLNAKLLGQKKIGASPIPQNFLDNFNFKSLGNRIALESKHVSISYGELEVLTSNLAYILNSQYGLGRNSKIALLLNQSPELIVAIFGILKCGAAYIPIDIETPKKRIELLLRDCSPDLVLIGKTSEQQFDAWHMLKIDLDNLKATDEKKENKIRRESDDLSYIMYTSGTTGIPKGVMVHDLAVSNYLNFFSRKFSLNHDDKVLQQASIAFDTAVEEIFPILSVGGTLVLSSEGNKNVSSLIAVADVHRVTILSTTPLIIKEINDNYFMPKTIRALISGGDFLKKNYIENIFGKCDLYNSYGPTETTVCATYWKIEKLEETSWIGMPIPNVNIYIVNEKEELLPKGYEGEIIITGQGVAKGYFNDQAETRKRFIPNTYDTTSQLAFKSGDVGFVGANGVLRFIGRNDNQYKVRGYRVDIQEIERVFLSHPGIDDAIVEISRKNSSKIIVYYTGRPLYDKKSLKKHASQHLPHYMIPSAYYYLENLPRTRNGKLDRKHMQVIEEPMTDVGNCQNIDFLNSVKESWETVLELKNIDIDTHLFELGGNSISAARIAASLSQTLKIDIQLKWLYDFPTIRSLAEKIADCDRDYLQIPACQNRDSFPLSLGQERIYHLCRVEQASIAYNESESFDISGNLNIEALGSSFLDLIERHQMLKAIITPGELPTWEVLQKVPTEYHLKFSKIVDSKIEENISKLIEIDAFTPFNFHTGPLFRFRLIEYGRKRYVLSAVIHHIITDGLSVALLFREWKELYSGRIKGHNPILPELHIGFGDFTNWQRDRLLNPSTEKIKAYWRKKLAKIDNVIHIPADYPRTVSSDYKGTREQFVLNKNLSEEIKHFCIKYACTPFTFFSSILASLFFKYTNKKDLLITYMENGRNHSSLVNLIGFFVNTLLLRIPISGENSFFSLTQMVKEQLQNDMKNNEAPFELLSEYSGLGPEELMQNVILVMQDNEASLLREFSFDNLHFKRRNKNYQTCKAGIVFFVEPLYDGSYMLDVEYDTNLFRKDRILRYMSHILNIIRSACVDPFKSISELDLLSEPELKFVLQDQNNTTQLTALNPENNLIKYFESQVQMQPEEIAITYLNEELSFKEVNNLANQIAWHLNRNCGAQKGDTVGLLVERSADFLVCLIGILKANCIYLPIDPDFPVERVKLMLEHSEANITLTKTAYLKFLDPLLYEVETLKSISCIDEFSTSDFSELEGRSRQLWNYTAGISSNAVEASGWISSISQKPFTKAEVDDIVYNVCEKVRPLITKESRILEVGCGSGLVMFELQGLVKEYVGTDISQDVINLCRKRIKKDRLSHVKTMCLSAIEIDKLKEKDFDLIIVNSVIQFFTHEYLRTFLMKSFEILKPNGSLFLFDVRDQNLRKDYYKYLNEETAHINMDFTVQLSEEPELFLDPGFFDDFLKFHNVIADISFSKKKETIPNELTKFRYDVLISKKTMKGVLGNNEPKKKVFRSNYIWEQPNHNLGNYSGPEDIIYILYTSGTTGSPKGVPIRQQGIMNRLIWTDKTFDFKRGDVLWQKSPASFDVSVWEMLFPICFGYQCAVCPKDIVSNPKELINYIEEKQITHAHFVPSMLNVFLHALQNEREDRIKVLRTIFSSGEELSPQTVNETLRLTNSRIFNLYGPTEASIDVSFFEARPGMDKIPIGKPIANTKLYILDYQLKPMPIGVPGELYISGVGLTTGYLKNDELTKTKFFPNPYVDNDIIYKTGDSAYWDEQGNIIYCGRIDDQVKVRGFRVELGEIDFNINRHPAVEKAVSFSLGKDEEGSLCTAVVPKKECALPLINSLRIEASMSNLLRTLPDDKPFFHPNSGETEFMYQEIFEREVYWNERMQIDKGDIIVDVGANSGMFCIYLNSFFANLNFFAIEPIPKLVECLKHNASLYEMKLTVIESGLSDNNEKSFLTYYKNNTIISHLSELEPNKELLLAFNKRQFKESVSGEELNELVDFANERETLEINLTTLSNIIENHLIDRIDLLKIDAEGSEFKILKGIKPYDWKKIKQIIVEVDNKESGREILDLLKSNGFSCQIITHPLLEGHEVELIYGSSLKQSQKNRGSRNLLPHLKWCSSSKLESCIINHCKSIMPDYMIPDNWLITDHIPMTRHGKVDKKSLANKIKNGRAYQNKPRNNTEEQIEEIWKEVLNLDNIDIKSDFFHIGGHSLKATRLMARFNENFEVQIKLKDIFENTTIEDQAIMLGLKHKQIFKKIKAIKNLDFYELSSAQRRFWIMEHLGENTYASNMPGSVKFTGELQISAIEQSLNLVIERHESLRTVFQSIAGIPRQVVKNASEVEYTIEVQNLEQVNDPLQQAKKIALEEAKIKFDLQQWPLFRTKILRINEDVHILLFTIHHIVSDGKSLEIIVQELMEFYNSIISKQTIIKKPLQLQYRDFANWQSHLIRSGSFEASGQYWQQLFRSPKFDVLIHPDFPRPKDFTTSGGYLNSEITFATRENLLEVCRELEITEFMLTYGIINLVVAIHSKERDITLGVPYSNREHSQLDNQVGNYLNLLPIRLIINDNETLGCYLGRIRKLILSAFNHSSYPFEMLVQNLDLPNQRNRMRLFDIGFTFNQESNLHFKGGDKKMFKNLEVELFEYTYQSVKADIWFNCSVIGGEYKFITEYNSNLFTESRMKEITTSISIVSRKIEERSTDMLIRDFLSSIRKTLHSNKEKERQEIRKNNISKLLSQS